MAGLLILPKIRAAATYLQLKTLLGRCPGGDIPEVHVDQTSPFVESLNHPFPFVGTLIDFIDFTFSEEITGFDISDLTLTKGNPPAPPNLLTGAQMVFTTDNKEFSLENLTSLTGDPGGYSLKLTAAGSGIQDLAGNPLVDDVVVNWSNGDVAYFNESNNQFSEVDVGEIAADDAGGLSD